MLCDLAIRRVSSTEDDGLTFVLRVTSKRVRGSAGGGGKEEKIFPSAEALLAFLNHDLGLTPEIVSRARQTLADEPGTDRAIGFASDVQIPFAVMEAADLSLYD